MSSENALIRGFASYPPACVVSNAEIGARTGCDAGWITSVSGIEERRFAEPD